MKIGKMEFVVEWADTPIKRTKGLMFRKHLKHALVFDLGRETNIGAAIHSIFVFFPFDIIWLNSKGLVVAMRTVGPFRLFESPGAKAHYFIELPAGTIRKSGIKLGQKINLS